MVNDKQGQVAIELQGETFILRITLGTLRRFKKATGKELQEFFARKKGEEDHLDLDALGLLLGLCMRDQDGKLVDEDRLDDLIDLGDLPDVLTKLIEAMGGDPEAARQAMQQGAATEGEAAPSPL